MPTLGHVHSTSSFTGTPVKSFSSSTSTSLAQSKRGFGFSSHLVPEEIRYLERKQAEENRRGAAKEINDRLSLKPCTCNLFAENVQGVRRQDICFMLFPEQPAYSAADSPTCSSNELGSHTVPRSPPRTWMELPEAEGHCLKFSVG